jgi:hypothetical protein
LLFEHASHLGLLCLWILYSKVEQIDFVLKQVDLELSGLSSLSSCDSLSLQHLKNVDQDLSSPETLVGAVERFVGLRSYPGDFY